VILEGLPSPEKRGGEGRGGENKRKNRQIFIFDF
jgi:hypothetical protein